MTVYSFYIFDRHSECVATLSERIELTEIQPSAYTANVGLSGPYLKVPDQSNVNQEPVPSAMATYQESTQKPCQMKMMQN